MPKRSMVAIFGPELEFVLFVAARRFSGRHENEVQSLW